MRKKVSVLLLLLLLCAAPLAHAQEFSPEALPLYKGIDVSAWQRDIDHKKVAESGISMVYIRSSLGADMIDPYFERNAEGFSKQGVQVGYYHYLTARTPESARHQARFFAELIRDKPLALRPAMDFERTAGLSRREIQEIARAFLTELEAQLNIRPALYSSASGARTRYDDSFARYPLWVANYGVHHPEPNGHWTSWAGFQYDDLGRVPGIEGHVDLDHFTSALRIDSDKPEPDPEPKPDCTRPRAYVVQKGDSLRRIARRFETSVNELLSLNPMRDPNRIFPGQVLYLP